jgi:hypothetical protein
MSKEPTNTRFRAGDFISENAVRGVFGQRRPTSPTIPAHAVSGMPEHSSAPGAETSPPPSEVRRLRRWSVAELLARAVAPAPSAT